MIQQESAARSKRILIVDDNELSGHLLHSILSAEGYDVELCYHGSEAIGKIENDPNYYDLICTDLLMPIMGGFDFIRNIKELGQKDNFFVISSIRDPRNTFQCNSRNNEMS